MKKFEAYMSQFKFYQSWHTDTKAPLMHWGVLVAFVLTMLNVVLGNINSYVAQLEQQALSDADNFAAIIQSRKDTLLEVLPELSGLPKETDRILVKYKDSAPGLNVAAVHANLEKAQGLKKLFTIEQIDVVVYQVSEDDTASEVVDRIKEKNKKDIEFAEVDMMVPLSFIPNDPYFTSAWHLPKIGAPAAWDSAKGAGVVVAILDTGVDCTHPDLAASCVSGWNFIDSNSNTADVHGHGTNVAGAAMAIGNNGVGVTGVAYEGKIMPLRIAGADGYSYISTMAQAINYAADNGARVINVSFGSVCGSQSLFNASNYLRSKGGVSVFAAGNYNSDDGSSASQSITCVSATDSSDTKASWSSFGNAVDVAAPGVGIYTTKNGGGYSAVSGTSFSSPLTAGTYALIFSTNPSLTPAEADSILLSTADDLGVAGWDIYSGYGRINAAKAVAAAIVAMGTQDSVPPSVPQNLRVTAVTQNAITLAWNQSLDDNSGVTGYDVYRNNTKITTVSGTTYMNTGLTPETVYTYTVRAEDASGNQSAQSVSVATSTSPIAFSISTYSVPSKTTNTATIAATLTKSGTVTVQYGTTSTNLNLSAVSTVSNINHTVNLTGLSPVTTYYYKIIATNGSTTVSSAVSSFKTNKTTGKTRR